MQSVRAQQIQAQRSKYAGFRKFSDVRRVGTPSNSLGTATGTIAKKTVEAEMKDKINSYNDGEISNDDMMQYLQGLLGNSLLTLSEKADVTNKLRDFNSQIQEQKLTANYNNTENGTPERVAAAKALATYYQQKAASQAAGTPAQSDALQKAGTWSQQVNSEQNSIEKSNRQLTRAQLFRQVANTQPGSIDEANQKAQAFQELANQARADGNETEAVQFETQSQNALNGIPAIQASLDKQATAGERKDIIDSINVLANDYHDGKITADQFAQAIPQLEGRAVGINDVSIQLALNKWSDTLAKDAEKGVKRGTFNGLPVVLGKGGSGGAQTSWDQEDFNYSDNIRLAKQLFDSGKIDANKYVALVGKSIDEHAQQVDERIQTIEQIAQTNPNEKVTFNGKKTRAADVLDQLYQTQDDLQGQVQAYNNGTFALVEVAPGQFNKSGGVTKGKSVATYQLIDTKNMPEGQYVQDKAGVYHQVQKQTYKLKPSDMANVQNLGSFSIYIDPKNPNVQYTVKQDSSGNPYIETNKQYVDVYEPGTSNKKTVMINPGDKNQIDDFATITAREQQQAQAATASAKPEVQTQNQPLNQPNGTEQFVNGVVKKGGDVLNAVKQTATNAFNSPQVQQPVKAVENAVQSVPAQVAKVVAPELPGTPSYAPASSVGVTPASKVAMPSVAQTSATVASPTAAAIRMPDASKLSINGAPQPNAIQQAASQGALKPAAIPAPNVPNNVTQQMQQAQQRDTSIMGSLNALKNNVMGLATKIWPFK